MKLFPPAWLSDHPDEALAPYLSPDQCQARFEELANLAGAEIICYGTSVEGRPLLAARLPSYKDKAPAVLCAANIHGPEFVGRYVALDLLRRAADLKCGRTAGDTELDRLLARAELWIIPSLNPDGYARTWLRAGKGSMAELRVNANGVDLNRNFPLPSGRKTPHLPGAGSTTKGKATYRGVSPLSEPETAHLAELFRRVPFLASANLHSTMGTLFPAHVKDKASFRKYRRLCRAFRDAQRFTGYLPLSSRKFDVFTGEQEDFQHHAFGTWAVCVEVFPVWKSLAQHLLAPSLFWRFNPSSPRQWIENDAPAVVAFLHAALDLSSI